jgi:hypothetical protein
MVKMEQSQKKEEEGQSLKEPKLPSMVHNSNIVKDLPKIGTKRGKR